MNSSDIMSSVIDQQLKLKSKLFYEEETTAFSGRAVNERLSQLRLGNNAKKSV